MEPLTSLLNPAILAHRNDIHTVGIRLKRFRILIVDDEVRILRFLTSKLKASGYEVITAQDGMEALELVTAQQPDLVVLDLILPKLHGFDVLRELRSFSSVPVVVLSALGADVERIKGLRLGADDYLPKPFNPDELLARIEAVKRRMGAEEGSRTSESVTFGTVDIDFSRRSITVDGKEQYLTRIEWLLLSELARNSGRLMLYEELLGKVWGQEYRGDIQILRTWVSRLRRKLNATSGGRGLIRTVPKAGYMIDQSPS
jgi:two-component system KDP operon response regulator KdpE